MVRRTGARARPPPGPRRMRHRQQTPDNPRAASTLARGLRAGMDQLPDCAAALHRLHQNLDAVVARPQPALPPLRPTRPLAPSRRSPRRARPRPHRHLLGLTPRPPPLLSNNAVGPTTAVTVGPVRVDIATIKLLSGVSRVSHALSDVLGARDRGLRGANASWLHQTYSDN